MTGFIAVHSGAGTYSSKNESMYIGLCQKACRLGASLLESGADANTIVTQVVGLLEDSDLVNAGHGSNLNINGNVECDAAIMNSGNGKFASVGSVKSVKNPIKLAYEILKEQDKPQLLGLVPPLCLVGEGATSKARSLGLTLVCPDILISPRSLREYRKYKRLLGEAETSDPVPARKRLKTSSLPMASNEQVFKDSLIDSGTMTEDTDSSLCQSKSRTSSSLLDTVGVICLDRNWNVACGVSSGGILLKQPGRLGHSCHFGCGCWAFRYSKDITAAACTSGCGEHIIKTNLAKSAADYIASSDNLTNPGSFLTKAFLNSPLLSDVDEKLCGLLLCKVDKTSMLLDFYFAHTTDSFCVGFMSASCSKPKVVLSRLPEKSVAGGIFASQGFMFKL